MLTAEELAAFAERGHVHLRDSFPRDAALQMQEHMWDELRREHGIARDDRTTWHQPRQSLRAAKWDPLQRAVETDAVVGAIDGLLGPDVRWSMPTNWGVVLVTFPAGGRDEWTLPSSGWHFDFDLHDHATAPAGLMLFTFFSSVAPRGGGTLIVEGSHRLLRAFHDSLSPEEQRSDHPTHRKQFLRWDPWLRALTGDGADRGQPQVVRGVPVRIVELTGEPGDVVVCHPLTLHVASQNRRDVPRFMRSQRICSERR